MARSERGVAFRDESGDTANRMTAQALARRAKYLQDQGRHGAARRTFEDIALYLRDPDEIRALAEEHRIFLGDPIPGSSISSRAKHGFADYR